MFHMISAADSAVRNVVWATDYHQCILTYGFKNKSLTDWPLIDLQSLKYETRTHKYCFVASKLDTNSYVSGINYLKFWQWIMWLYLYLQHECMKEDVLIKLRNSNTHLSYTGNRQLTHLKPWSVINRLNPTESQNKPWSYVHNLSTSHPK